MSRNPEVGGAGGVPPETLRIAVIAGEHSGDQLGFKLMRALRARSPRPIVFSGIGGDRMEAEGLRSLFPLADIAVMGFVPVIRRLPTLLRRIREAAAAVVADSPDALVIIDSPDFTHRVAKLVRRQRPDIPIVDYVSPSVWAWRSGRAKAMRASMDHVLALLPFEPEAHRRLGGPLCSYVGHPLIERLDELRPNAAEAERRRASPPVLLVLPGSRRSEIRRLTQDFGDAVALVAARVGPVELVLPAVDHLADEIRARTARWTLKPRIVLGEAAKLAAFRSARAALAASGTVTVELALAAVPTVVAYKVAPFETWLKYVIKVPSIVLPNLILDALVVPEFIQHDCTPARLADALAPLLLDGEARTRQLDAFARLEGLMRLADGETPSDRAAAIVLDTLTRPRQP
ncbi:lipid-A-disaccharide synthase [Lichenifustis flavocetrariae]|nr:lipid-A-disaccharide synthase [Lichenifustis flavocetrariae]